MGGSRERERVCVCVCASSVCHPLPSPRVTPRSIPRQVDQLVPGTGRVKLGAVCEADEAALEGYLAYKKLPTP